jgi:hypothetical protein
LTEKQKQIAWDAFYALWSQPESVKRECVWAAVEAVLAEQARAAEQGQACADCGCWIKMGTHCEPCYQARTAEHLPFSRERHRMNGCVEYDGDMGYPDNRCAQCKQHDTTTQTPAQVVERIAQRFSEMEGEDDITEHARVAVAIAREGYGSLEDMERAIRFEIGSGWGLDAEHVNSVIHRILLRATKPAEQTPEQIVERILLHKFTADFGRAGMVAAEIVDALKAGKQ